MQNLNLPAFAHRLIQRDKQAYILDVLRKKYVALKEEEWVRQHMTHYLIHHLHYPPSLMCTEQVVTQMRKGRLRTDIIIHNPPHKVWMIVECKAPGQVISQDTLEQAVLYNQAKSALLVLTNGIRHFCFQMDNNEKGYHLLKKIPSFTEIKKHYAT